MRTVGFAFTNAALDALEELPHKIRRQVIKKSRSLHTTPFPPGCKKLQGIVTEGGGAVYRERSGDYRILYAVKENPAEIIILDIDHRKDVYKMPKIDSTPAADEMRMNEAAFDDIMREALGTAPPLKSLKPAQDKVVSIEQENRRKSRKQPSTG
jgi:mRNA interferase RelE/StbE